jgi:flagellar hook-basal body complex protein FliE
MPIDPVSLATGPLSLGTPAASPLAAKDATSFANKLGDLVSNAEAQGTQANTAIGHMLDGTGDVHDAMIAMQRAEMTLQLTVQVRNKLVQAYQDIMRMPV